MREIKFRGKSKMTIEELDSMNFEHDNGWFYGNLVMYGNTPYIVGDLIEADPEYIIHEFWMPVLPESVGQYTGLKDKNCRDIYEGDIVQFNGMYEVKLGEHGIPSLLDAEYVDFAYGFYFKTQHDLKDIEPFGFDIPINKQYAKEVEVIGNIYENPELLEGDN